MPVVETDEWVYDSLYSLDLHRLKISFTKKLLINGKKGKGSN